MGLLGVYWAPKDVQDASDAAGPWKTFWGMLDRETLLWVFAFGLAAWVVWTDLRPFLQKLWATKRYVGAFDKQEGWSVSIETTGVTGHIPAFGTVYFQGFRFTNLSSKCRRILDLRIDVPTDFEDQPTITFDTQFHTETAYREYLEDAVTPGSLRRDLRWLPCPIEMEPQSVVEGQIDFRLPSNLRDADVRLTHSLRIPAATLTVKERLSGAERTLYLGQHYNARTGQITDPRHPEDARKIRSWLRGIVKKMRR